MEKNSLRLLVVDDEEAARYGIRRALEAFGHEISEAESAEAARALMRDRKFDLLLLDVNLPGISGLEFLNELQTESEANKTEAPLVIIITAHGSERLAVQAVKSGAYDYISKPFELDDLRLVVKNAFETIQLRRENRSLRRRIEIETSQRGALLGNSGAMQSVRAMIEKVADTDATVLVRGESGTGKELVARELHDRSTTRSGGAFVAVNCAALPTELIESELFGHEKGAFTGAAARRRGKFEQANGGTLFLDEIGDMSANVQAKLLRALEERRIERLGGNESIPVDVRIISATHRPLDSGGARLVGGCSRRLVGPLGGAPSGVQTKLLAALLGAVVLLIVVGVLGMQAIADSNGRAEALRALQQRATAYRALQADAEQIRQLLGLRAGGPDLQAFVPPAAAPTGAALTALDTTIATAITRLGPGGDLANLGFRPPAAEQATLDRIASDEGQLAGAMTRIIAFDRAGATSQATQVQGAEAEPLRNDLLSLTGGLVAGTTAETNALIAENLSAFGGSQRTFVAVAVLSVVLALVLGYALSWSVIGPIKRMEARLAAIASGDFSGHVDVPNRDELGALAANINQMNDELGRLYKELESASRHKSEFLANMSHELRTPLNAIIGFSEVLHEEMSGPLNVFQRQYVEDVREAGQHLLSLINDILDLSKVEAGQMELALAEVSILETLESGVTMHQARATRNEITFNLRIDRLFDEAARRTRLSRRGQRRDADRIRRSVDIHALPEREMVALSDSAIRLIPCQQLMLLEPIRM